MECAESISNESLKGWYYGCKAEDELKLFLEQNCKYQKVLFVVGDMYYESAKSFGNNDYEQIILPSSAINVTDTNSGYADIRFVVGYGDCLEITKAKYLAESIGAQCILYITTLVPIDYLLDENLALVGNEWKVLSCDIVPRVIIDENMIRLSKRERVVNCVSSLYCLLGFFTDYIINEEIFKTECVIGVFDDIKNQYNKLYSLMNRIKVLEGEALCELMDIVIELVPILRKLNYSINGTKEHSWAVLYEYLNRSSLGLPIMKMVAFDILLNMYTNFVNKFDSVKCGCIDIEKRTKLFDKYLSKSSFNFVLEEILCSTQMQFILKNSLSTIKYKLSVVNEIAKRLKIKLQDTMQDKGYSISTALDRDTCLLASFFVADIIKGKSFVKIIRDFGVLDFK